MHCGLIMVILLRTHIIFSCIEKGNAMDHEMINPETDISVYKMRNSILLIFKIWYLSSTAKFFLI